jgi:hypothetical protein
MNMSATNSSSSTTAKSSSANGSKSTNSRPPLIGMKVSSLLKSLDPIGMFELDTAAEEQLLALANDFASTLIKGSMRVAEHRRKKRNLLNIRNGSAGTSTTAVGSDGSKGENLKDQKRVEVQDVSLVLRKNWGITVPGLSATSDRFSTTKGTGRSSLSAGRNLGSSMLKSNNRSEMSSSVSLGVVAGLAVTSNGKRKHVEVDTNGGDRGPPLKKIDTKT